MVDINHEKRIGCPVALLPCDRTSNAKSAFEDSIATSFALFDTSDFHNEEDEVSALE